MRIRYVAQRHPRGGFAVWDKDEGRWDGRPMESLADAEAAARQASEEFWSSVQSRAARVTGGTVGFYFGGMTNDEINAMRARLADVAATLGYMARAGREFHEGKGSTSLLIAAIANGDVTVQRRQES